MRVQLRGVLERDWYYALLLRRGGRRDRRRILIRTPNYSTYLEAMTQGEVMAAVRGWIITSAAPLPVGYWRAS
jgi:hypothetical protein